MRFRALSLLDITKTGVSRHKEVDDQKRVAQFANYMTVENCLQGFSGNSWNVNPKWTVRSISGRHWKNCMHQTILSGFKSEKYGQGSLDT